VARPICPLLSMAARSTKASRPKGRPEPQVGIFWLLDSTLLTDSTPLNQAEPYGDRLTHPRSHIDVWDCWQKLGKVPVDVPYEEPPRGRVVFNLKTSEPVLLADKCILKRKSVIAEITKALGLPKNVTLGSDSHYRCSKCLYGSDTEANLDD
jgi:hypothetical protein